MDIERTPTIENTSTNLLFICGFRSFIETNFPLKLYLLYSIGIYLQIVNHNCFTSASYNTQFFLLECSSLFPITVPLFI